MKKSRRSFVKTLSVGTAGTLVLGSAACTSEMRKHNRQVSKVLWPSDRLNVAVVGITHRGYSNIRALKDQAVNIVALCDVDWGESAQKVFAEFPDAKQYKDFRRMLDKEKHIDAVVVATPDHAHGIVASMAIQLGKHVYCEKPLAHSIYETRLVTNLAQEYGVQTQMGNQGHSSEKIRLLKEWVDAGLVGDITEIHAWCDRPAGGGSVSFLHGQERPTGDFKVPKTLDWDLWLGPALERPYHPDYLPMKWRGYLDFGCGALGDFGCHTLDPAFWALDLGSPDKVLATTTNQLPKIEYDTFPTSSIITYWFPKRGNKPPVKLMWYDGGITPKWDERFDEIGFGTNGALLVSDKGIVQHGSHGAGGLQFKPFDKTYTFEDPAPTIPRVNGHQADWVNACKTGNPSSANFNYGGPLTEMVSLGVAAGLLRDQKLEWDAENMIVKNSEEANLIIHPEFRKGWEM
ncbi:MAG: Gfo/Idh/MocA family oxidoreductase [Bacteroidetes bacterium]|nr:Gfo/Idh/MocA family oxidoreductase [Bacteroidota bacterium]